METIIYYAFSTLGRHPTYIYVTELPTDPDTTITCNVYVKDDNSFINTGDTVRLSGNENEIDYNDQYFYRNSSYDESVVVSDYVSNLSDGTNTYVIKDAEARASIDGKVDVGHEVIEFQEPTSANNYLWYRKYADGWVEQGGRHPSPGKTVTLPVEMADTNYETIINTLYNNSSAALYNELGYVSKTTTSFTKGGNATEFNWVVYGMAAS